MSRLITVWALAIQHARREFPRECCGLVVNIKGRARYVECKNSAVHPEDDFVLDPQEYESASELGDVIAVVHSHPNASCRPSVHDLSVQAVSGLEWWIIGLPSGADGPVESQILPSKARPPLFGRSFYFGAADCYALVRDWYAEVLDIDLPDFARTDKFWERGENLFEDNFVKAGFERLPNGSLPIHGDVLLMKISTNAMPNHSAVWLHGDRIAHHLQGRLSAAELYSRFYRDRTVAVLRYKGQS